MVCHQVDYRIHGNDMQLVEVELDPGETVIAEAGVMTYMEEGIEFETRLGDGSEATGGVWGKLWGAGKRMLTGESLFMTHFTNRGGGKSRVAFAAPHPGRILALDLGALGGAVVCQKDAFLAAALGTHIGITLSRRIGAGFFGGEGFILQKLTGDGLVFLHACGAIVEKELNGESIRMDTGALVAYSPGMEIDITMSGGLKSMLFGGEGMFLTTVRGKGKVWMQSLPFSRLAERIQAGFTLEKQKEGEKEGRD